MIRLYEITRASKSTETEIMDIADERQKENWGLF